MAEESLRSCIRAMNEWAAQEDGLPDTAADAVEEALSALSLLASEPAKGADVFRAEGALAAEVRAALDYANGRWCEWGERAENVEEILRAGLREYERAANDDPAPDADAGAPETIIGTVQWVLNDAHYKAPEQIAGLWREVWAPKLRTAIDAMPVGAPAPPASDEVREAAEILCERLDGGAGERYYREVVPGLVGDIEALRAALRATASPAPGSEAVREAAETRFATRPDRGDNKVPYCSEQCPQHDGKRCRIMGGRPSAICEPEVLNILSDVAALRGGQKGGE